MRGLHITITRFNTKLTYTFYYMLVFIELYCIRFLYACYYCDVFLFSVNYVSLLTKQSLLLSKRLRIDSPFFREFTSTILEEVEHEMNCTEYHYNSNCAFVFGNEMRKGGEGWGEGGRDGGEGWGGIKASLNYMHNATLWSQRAGMQKIYISCPRDSRLSE